MANETETPKPSPFKFLDPYGPEDRGMFFGRDDDIAKLYTKLYASPITVLYGESGAGKTSLIQCGLRNYIELEDMLFVFVRIADDPESALRLALLKAAPQIPDDGLDLDDYLRLVIRRSRQTVLLVFDQFEEFLLLQRDKDVRHHFASQLDKWLGEGLNLRLLFAIRQEFLAQLTDLEKDLPGLYDNRLWLRRMSTEQAEDVITGPCNKAGVGIDDGLVRPLLDALNSNGQGIDLPTLQVVLDRLYRQALITSDSAPVLSLETYQGLGQIHTILYDFMDARIKALGEQEKVAKKILNSLVTPETTRLSARLEDIALKMEHDPEVRISDENLHVLLEILVNNRILREDPDRHCFELRHDALAPHVRNWMSKEDQEVEFFRESLRYRLRGYRINESNLNNLLDAKFIDDLEPYKDRLGLDRDLDLAKFVKASKDKIQAEKECLRKQRQKKRFTVVAIGCSFLLLASFVIMKWWGAEIRKGSAEDSYNIAKECLDRLFTLISEEKRFSNPYMKDSRQNLLKNMVNFYYKHSNQREDDLKLKAELAEFTLKIADIDQKWGDNLEAKLKYNNAIDLFRELEWRSQNKPEYLNNQAKCRTNLGSLLEKAGSQQDAQKSYKEAIRIEETLKRDYPQEPEYLRLLGSICVKLGQLQRDSGDLSGAHKSFQDAIDNLKSLLARHLLDEAEYQNNLVSIYDQMGNLQRESKALSLATDPKCMLDGYCLPNQEKDSQVFEKDFKSKTEKYYNEALTIAEELVVKHQKVPDYQYNLALTYVDLGEFQLENCEPANARKNLKKAADTFDKLATEHTENPSYRQKFVYVQRKLAWIETFKPNQCQ